MSSNNKSIIHYFHYKKNDKIVGKYAFLFENKFSFKEK